MNKKSIGIGIIIGIGAALAIGATSGGDDSSMSQKEKNIRLLGDLRLREAQRRQQNIAQAAENLPTKPSYGREPGRFVALEVEGGFEVEATPNGVNVVLLDTATGVFCGSSLRKDGSTFQLCSGTFANYGR
jgi:hypothetical protein